MLAALLLALEPSASALLIAGIAVFVIGPLLVRAAQGRFDIFEPLVPFALAWGGMFVIRPISMIENNEFSYLYSPALDLTRTFDKMLLFAFLGGLAFVVGYGLPQGRRLASRLPGPPEGFRTSTLTLAALGAAGLGLLSFAIYVLQSGVALDVIFGGRSLALFQVLEDSNKYFTLGPVLLVGATVVTFALGIGRKIPALVVVSLGLAAVSWVIWNTVGSRLVLFPMFAAMGIFYYLSQTRRPHLAIVAVAVLFAVFASTVVREQRSAETRRDQGLGGVATQVLANPASMVDPVLTGTDNAMAPGLAAALALVPSQIDYTYGGPFVTDLLTRPIPRAVWASKPRSPREELTQKLNPTDYQAGTANPEFSNLLVPYLSWGMFGALFLVLYGIGARAVYEWFLRHRLKLSAQLLYALTLPLFIVTFRDSLVDVIAFLALIVGPVWVLFLVGRVRIAN